MKNKKVMYGGMFLLVIVGLICVLLTVNAKEQSKIIDYDMEYIVQSSNNYNYIFINDYEEYKKYIDDQRKNNVSIIGEELGEDKFNGSRYLLLKISNFECNEDLNYSNIKYANDSYKVYFNVNKRCGSCLQTNKLYQIKVGASDTSKIYVLFKTLSEEKCN